MDQEEHSRVWCMADILYKKTSPFCYLLNENVGHCIRSFPKATINNC